jgi:predicted tellurium resistance membrane protein TerC
VSLLSTEGLVSLASLTALEIVLGIDNIVFIAILSQRLPAQQQKKVRRLGLVLALGLRVALLLTLSFIMGLVRPLFTLLGHPISGRDLVLLVGGLFLIAKSVHEIYDKLEAAPEAEAHGEGGARASFGGTLAQILALDVVFSLDSVITAVGMVQHIPIMVTAIIIAVGIMLLFADAVSGFIERHPSMKILALSFLLMIGVLLVADAFGRHVEKGYVYFAMGFSLLVELLNIRMTRKRRGKPVELRKKYGEPPAG